ncbi:MAG: adenine deaminase, partial [Bacillati bacterium ANGP1]
MKRTSRTAEDLKMLLAVASGREPADLYLDGATLLNVYSGEIYPANVAVKGRRIAYVGRGRGMVGPETQVLSLPGRILAPG